MSIKIGMVGYGNVGKAFLRLIEKDRKDIEVIYIIRSNGLLVNENGLDLKSILVMEEHLYNHPDWKSQKGFLDVVEQPIDYLVELTPTDMENGEPAFTYITEAMKRGIHVVTGNKGPVLKHYRELKLLADRNRVKLGISCTAGGALPSLEVGRFGLAGSKIQSITGILNGTTNYILTLMAKEEISYEEALQRAQDEGIAEKDPQMDVNGYDTAIKMLIITNELLSCELWISDVNITGISGITLEEIKKAKKQNKKIKLIGKTEMKNQRVFLTVQPVLLTKDSPLFDIDGKEKGICYETDHLGNIVVSGGASDPSYAAGAILRDIANIERSLR